MKRFISSAISLAVCSVLVLAQTATARLSGTVLDTAGMAIPKVQITVRNSTVSFNAVSDEDGKISARRATWNVRSSLRQASRLRGDGP
jgi:hypothetical protein